MKQLFPMTKTNLIGPVGSFQAKQNLDAISNPRSIPLIGEDDALQSYFGGPASSRKYDVLIEAPYGYFWNSEYNWDGLPANFQCSFVVCIDPNAAGVTDVGIIQVDCKVLVGTKFALDGTDLAFKFMDDIRPVPPTTTDSLKLLNAIEQSLLDGHMLNPDLQ